MIQGILEMLNEHFFTPAAVKQVMSLNNNQFSLQRLFFYISIVSVTCSAVIGIGQILTGNDRNFRILATAATIAVASVCGLGCGAALDKKRARIIPIAGLIATLGASLGLLMIIWNESRGLFNWFPKTTLVLSVYAIGFSHISLLSIARLSSRYNWAFTIALVAILTVATLLSYPIIFDGPLSDAMIRWIAVVSIVDALMSILIPIFHLLSQGQLRVETIGPCTGTSGSSAEIESEIARLEARLVELRKLRQERI